MLRFDAVALDLSRAITTPEGWIRDRPVLTRAGVFRYVLPDGRVRREYRPPAHVFDPAHMESLRGVPVTVDHPGKLATAETAPVTIGAAMSAGERRDSEMLGELVIHNPRAMQNRRELSLGYSIGGLDETPGRTDSGEEYDAVQLGPYTINHVAVVAKGRAGSSRLRLDAEDAVLDEAAPPATPEDQQMSEATMPVRLDGNVTYQVPPPVAAALDALRADAAQTATQTAARIAALEGERDAERARADAAEARIPQAVADATAAARARVVLEGVARQHGVEVRADASDNDIRAAVVTKLAPGADLAGKPQAYVEARFDMAVADAALRAANGAAQAAQAAPAAVRADAAPASTRITSAEAARAAMIRRSA